jgi:hypothetical protein
VREAHLVRDAHAHGDAHREAHVDVSFRLAALRLLRVTRGLEVTLRLLADGAQL